MGRSVCNRGSDMAMQSSGQGRGEDIGGGGGGEVKLRGCLQTAVKAI